MAILNLLDLQPTTISRDLRNKYILLYGLPKVGKTSFAAQCPNNLIFCFEKGVNFLPGVYAADVPKWTDFKALLKQLDKQEIKEKFHTVTIDTISIAWELCSQYVCTQNGVKALGDIPWGRGYALLKDEFSSALRQISMMGYGMILITHAKTKIEDIGDDKTIEIVSPNIPDRAQDIVNALVDIIGYIQVDWKETESGPVANRTLITRGTPTVVAGSRLKYLASQIPFGYHELTNAIGEAIEKQQSLDGAVVTDKDTTQAVITKRPFEETVAEARTHWERIVSQNENNAELIMAKVENIFGQPIRLSEITEAQQDLFEILIDELRAM
jgi:hypothetical protein